MFIYNKIYHFLLQLRSSSKEGQKQTYFRASIKMCYISQMNVYKISNLVAFIILRWQKIWQAELVEPITLLKPLLDIICYSFVQNNPMIKYKYFDILISRYSKNGGNLFQKKFQKHNYSYFFLNRMHLFQFYN